MIKLNIKGRYLESNEIWVYQTYPLPIPNELFYKNRCILQYVLTKTYSTFSHKCEHIFLGWQHLTQILMSQLISVSSAFL